MYRSVPRPVTLVFPTRAALLKEDSAGTRSGWQATPVSRHRKRP